MRGETLTVTQPVTFDIEECCSCGAFFAVTTEFKRQRVQDHGSFYCPSGHGQSYTGKTDAQKLREAKAEAAAEQARLRAQLQAEADQRQAAERELKRHRQRAKGGVCPCCNRSFVQLARHMKTQHPKFEP